MVIADNCGEFEAKLTRELVIVNLKIAADVTYSTDTHTHAFKSGSTLS